MKNAEHKLMKSIYRHIGKNVERTAFYGGCIFTGDKGSVECHYPITEVFTSACESGQVKTVYK